MISKRCRTSITSCARSFKNDMALAGFVRRALQHSRFGIYTHLRGLCRHGVTMEDIREKSRLNEEPAGGSGAKDQCPAVERSPIQPQASGFNKIDCSDFIALLEKHLVSSKCSSLKRLWVEILACCIEMLATYEHN